MDPKHLFMDERLMGMCVYCGAQPDTRDHVPSKVLLDEPYPPELPVVSACEGCNNGFSLDEQYLACLIECIVFGTVEPTDVQRPNVRRILRENSALQHRIEASEKMDAAGNLLWPPEHDRVRRIVTKLARGHAAYDLYPILEEPDDVLFAPLATLSDRERAAFQDAILGELEPWPELGSRAFLRAFGKNLDGFEQVGGWIVVQNGRYRYSVTESDGVLVRMVLSEYLACAVSWT